ncbi:hypothetical protein DPEC_G00153770 [Dallia pectoralis]|uniref:Uncharacterized protein n=1 Tax=Dallia pectoralis TaxID=75939 RepID=A0ACC2GKF3_DALPE|nr:hypothetical protein DPEC_G00153770 [Dallia pectoralis]
MLYIEEEEELSVRKQRNVELKNVKGKPDESIEKTTVRLQLAECSRQHILNPHNVCVEQNSTYFPRFPQRSNRGPWNCSSCLPLVTPAPPTSSLPPPPLPW